MCGIAGFIKKNTLSFDSSLIKRFSAYNRFRGPDAYGEFIHSGSTSRIALAHHRLSIIDLTTSANQPMENNSWVIVFNGEIYNYQNLRTELEKEGIQFRTQSDTETILELFEKLDPKTALSKLDGMFAIAAYHKATETLILARDRWGKKPLYYFSDDQNFAFSSDIRSFTELEINLSINTEGLKYYFSELSFPQPETVFNEVKQVFPGDYLELKNDVFSTQQYIDLFETHPQAKETSSQKVAQQTKKLLEDAVQKRQIADLDVGSFLSGGIDSGLIVALASKNKEKLNTYTVGFDDNEFDERPFAKILAKKYNTNHNELLVNSNDIDIEKLVLEFGEPFADSSMIPSYLISKEVTNYQKVVLSGDGGDELFCGNATYNLAYKLDDVKLKTELISPVKSILSKLPVRQLNSLGKLHKDPLFFSYRELYRNLGFKQEEFSLLFKENSNYDIQNVFSEYIQSTGTSVNDIFHSIYNGSIRTRLLNDYLVKVDRASMYASLEVRSPFLDDNLHNYINTLPKEAKMPNKVLKGILKNLANELLPEEILNKPKTGFGIPLDNWLRTKWKELFTTLVLEKKQNAVDLNYDFIKKLWKKHLDGVSYGHRLFALLVFHIWMNHFNKSL